MVGLASSQYYLQLASLSCDCMKHHIPQTNLKGQNLNYVKSSHTINLNKNWSIPSGWPKPRVDSLSFEWALYHLEERCDLQDLEEQEASKVKHFFFKGFFFLLFFFWHRFACLGANLLLQNLMWLCVMCITYDTWCVFEFGSSLWASTF